MHSSTRRQAMVVSSAAAALMLSVTACSSTSHSSTPTTTSGPSATSAPTGSTAATGTPIKIGILTDVTGPLASSFGGVAKGAQARIDQQNAEGGVNGHPIQLVIGDDQSNPNDVLSVTQSLVQQKGVFAVMDDSPFFSEVYTYLEQQGIPVVADHPNDGGPEWASPTTSDLVDGAGASNPSNVLQPAGWGWLIKILQADHVTKLATIAYGANKASASYAAGIKAAADAAGIPDVDEDNSIAQTQTDLTANAVKMKSSGANGWVGITAAGTEEALVTALHQQGANIKGVVLNNYIGDWLQSPLNAADQGLVVTNIWKTPEIDSTIGNNIVNAMKQYGGYTGTTAYGLPAGAQFGWADATLAIAGLEGAGSTPTASSFLAALHGMSAYDVGGEQAPVNLAVSAQGSYAPATAGNCSFAIVVSGSQYGPLSTQPFCSTSAG